MLTLNNINGQYIKFYFTTNPLLPELLKNTAAIIILQEYANEVFTDNTFFSYSEDMNEYIWDDNTNNINTTDHYSFVNDFDYVYLNKELSSKQYSEIDTYRLCYSMWIGGKKIISGHGMYESTELFLDNFFKDFLKLYSRANNLEKSFVSNLPWEIYNSSIDINTVIDNFDDYNEFINNNTNANSQNYDITYTYFVPRQLPDTTKNGNKNKVYMVDIVKYVNNIIDERLSIEEIEATNIQYEICYIDNNISTEEHIVTQSAFNNSTESINIDNIPSHALFKYINISFNVNIPLTKINDFIENDQGEIRVYIKTSLNSNIDDTLYSSEFKKLNKYYSCKFNHKRKISNKIVTGSYESNIELYTLSSQKINITLPTINFNNNKIDNVYIDTGNNTNIKYITSLLKFNNTDSYYYSNNITSLFNGNIPTGERILYFYVNEKLKINNIYLSLLNVTPADINLYSTSEYVNVTNYCIRRTTKRISINDENYNIYSIHVNFVNTNNSNQFNLSDTIIYMPILTGQNCNNYISIKIDLEPELILNYIYSNVDIISDKNGLSNNDETIRINNKIYDTMDWLSILNKNTDVIFNNGLSAQLKNNNS